MSDQELIDFYIRNRDLFHNNNIISGLFRWIAWGICKILIILADVCKSVYDTAFGLIDFTANEKINVFIESFKPLLVMLLALSLLAMGISLIMGGEKRPKAVQNALIMIICVCCSTVVFSEMNRMTISFKNAVRNFDVARIVFLKRYRRDAFFAVDDGEVRVGRESRVGHFFDGI